MVINLNDAVRFYDDPNIYEVSGIITDNERIFCCDLITGKEFEKKFKDVEDIWHKKRFSI